MLTFRGICIPLPNDVPNRHDKRDSLIPTPLSVFPSSSLLGVVRWREENLSVFPRLFCLFLNVQMRNSEESTRIRNC